MMKVTKNNIQRLASKMGESKTIISDMKDTIRNTSARIVNALSGSEMGKIPVVKLRDVEKLFHLKGEAEITQNELGDLENRKIVANLGGRGIVQLQEDKEKEKKELNSRIKKLKKEIEKIDFKGPIIDRSRTTEEINTKIDVAADEFQKL